jgi:hypothetical protein
MELVKETEATEATVEEKLLTAEDILAAEDLTTKKIYVPEWKGTVMFRVMNGLEAVQFQDVLSNTDNRSGVARVGWIKIFAMSAINPDGTRMFTERQIAKLMEKNSAVFFRLQDELMDLNGLTVRSRQVAKNV